jgi:hypothetical protein
MTMIDFILLLANFKLLLLPLNHSSKNCVCNNFQLIFFETLVVTRLLFAIFPLLFSFAIQTFKQIEQFSQFQQFKHLKIEQSEQFLRQLLKAANGSLETGLNQSCLRLLTNNFEQF